MSTAWPEVALGDVCTITMGQAPSGESYNTEGDGWPLISGAGDFTEGQPRAKKFTSKKTKLCEPGDIILGIRASIGAKVLADKVYCLGRGVAGLRAKSDLNERYLWHWLDAIADYLASKGRGATFKQVSRNDVIDLKIPLPPLDEQRRIAAILDKADGVRSKRKAALETLETLSQAIFIEMFGITESAPISMGTNLGPHARGWQWEELGSVARLATGHTPDRDRPDYWNGGIPWISLTEIRNLDGRIAENTELKVSAEGITHSSSVVLPPGTVCFSRTASIGFVTVTGTEMATSQDFVNWVCGDLLEPIYLMTALSVSRPQLRTLSTGSTHKTIYMRIAERFRVLLPPIDLQRTFAEQVKAIWKSQSYQENSLSETHQLFASLQQKAFQGVL